MWLSLIAIYSLKSFILPLFQRYCLAGNTGDCVIFIMLVYKLFSRSSKQGSQKSDCLVSGCLVSSFVLWVSEYLHLHYLTDWQPAQLYHIALFHIKKKKINFVFFLFYGDIALICLIMSCSYIYFTRQYATFTIFINSLKLSIYLFSFARYYITII